ncbi:hypothetical protein RhiirB3_493158 [Rhizophagus irregularis]|nr:hypothetical protein RhiirB3_493158 [Rhizophagus irregularis]
MTNVKNEQLLGTVLISSEGRPYVWKAVDISAERENFTAVINKTEAMLTEFKKKGITVCAIVTDSASVYAAARRRMRILKRSIIFLPCFAHQINLCVGKIFKESTEFKTTIDRAIRLATYFKNSNHKFFIAHLKEQQYETYKKYIAIAVPGETRWNSVYYMCISLLKTQQALQILAINYKLPIVETHRQGGALTLPREIFEIIDSSTFWDQLILINEILEPYCKILNVLQCDKARLFQFNNSIPNVNYSEFGKWLMYYYHVWSGKEPKCILREFDDFRLAKYPFDLESYKQFDNDIFRYWCYVSVSTNELGLVACRIFGICVNAASVERLWSCMGFLQTKRRNRLMSSKALQMSKLRADITYSHRLHNNPTSIEPTLDIDDTNKTDVNQNPSSLENSKDNDPVGILEDSSEPIGEDSDEETTELPLENDFGEYLQGWAEMLEEEENVGFDEESSEENDISLDDVTHPANDTNAKWPLAILFNNDISIGLPF